MWRDMVAYQNDVVAHETILLVTIIIAGQRQESESNYFLPIQ